jgi:hypothetical protein
MERRAFLLLVAVFVFAVDFLSDDAPARANTKIRVGLPDFTSSSVPFEIARQMGYFSQEGLDVEIIRMSCAVSVRALVRAQNFYRTRKSESLPLMMQFSKLESSELTQRVYDYLLPSMTVDGSLPDTVVVAEMQRATKSLKLVKIPQAQEIFDFSYVREASRTLAQR